MRLHAANSFAGKKVAVRKDLVCHDPKEKLASRPGAAPGKLSFGDSVAQAGARLMGNDLVRLPGIAPGLPPWRGGILLLNHSREN